MYPFYVWSTHLRWIVLSPFEHYRENGTQAAPSAVFVKFIGCLTAVALFQAYLSHQRVKCVVNKVPQSCRCFVKWATELQGESTSLVLRNLQGKLARKLQTLFKTLACSQCSIIILKKVESTEDITFTCQRRLISSTSINKKTSIKHWRF